MRSAQGIECIAQGRFIQRRHLLLRGHLTLCVAGAARFAELHMRAVEPLAGAVEQWAAQHGVALAIPSRQLSVAMFAMDAGCESMCDRCETDVPRASGSCLTSLQGTAKA